MPFGVPSARRAKDPRGTVVRSLTHVLFPSSGVVSVLVPIGEEPAVEAGLIGFEGMVGVPLALGKLALRSTSAWAWRGLTPLGTVTDLAMPTLDADMLSR